MVDDEILEMSVQDIKNIFKKLGTWVYFAEDPDQALVVCKIVRAVEELAYAKGFKAGKRIGSKECFNHLRKIGELKSHGYFILHGNADENKGKYAFYECSCCHHAVLKLNKETLPYYCPFCGAKIYNAPNGEQKGGWLDETN